MKRTLQGASLAVLALALAGGTAIADTSGKRIALSNNYAGNSWRQAMLRSWDKVTSQAVADGVVAAADAFTTAENQVTEQAAMIQNLVLQGYDARYDRLVDWVTETEGSFDDSLLGELPVVELVIGPISTTADHWRRP